MMTPYSQLSIPQLTPLWYNTQRINTVVDYFEDIMEYVGRYFGNWLVIADAGRDAKSNKLFLAQCKCKKIATHKLKTLMSGDTTQCQKCCTRSRSNFIDISGQTFGKWTVLKISENKYKNLHYQCKCECGNEKDINGYRLRNGMTNSCRKCRFDVKTHGMSYSSTYKIWRDMLSRCENQNLKSFKHYGGRGISVCDHWAKFENFLQDMGIRPTGLQIDRIDNDGNYEPKNCRWVTPKVNRNNQRPAKKKDK